MKPSLTYQRWTCSISIYTSCYLFQLKSRRSPRLWTSMRTIVWPRCAVVRPILLQGPLRTTLMYRPQSHQLSRCSCEYYCLGLHTFKDETVRYPVPIPTKRYGILTVLLTLQWTMGKMIIAASSLLQRHHDLKNKLRSPTWRRDSSEALLIVSLQSRKFLFELSGLTVLAVFEDLLLNFWTNFVRVSSMSTSGKYR